MSDTEKRAKCQEDFAKGNRNTAYCSAWIFDSHLENQWSQRQAQTGQELYNTKDV